MSRKDGRADDEIRPLNIRRGYLDYAEGSAMVEWGKTWVLCACSVEEQVPPWMKGSGKGWLTAEYGMLPKSSKDRIARPIGARGVPGRTSEIQRLIGRALRGVVNLEKLGERTLRIDCDVIQADGGTRTASITGAMVALHDAMGLLQEAGLLKQSPLNYLVAAVSVGLVKGAPLTDLDYAEDSAAEVDMNVVMTDDDRYIEVQGTAEGAPFTHEQHAALLTHAQRGIEQVLAAQRAALGL